MLLEVPYLYTIKGYYPRERTLLSECLVAMTIVRVREIDGASAPVVARCTWSTALLCQDELGQASTRPGMAHTDYRLVDGQLVRRLGMDVDSVGGRNTHPHGLDLPEMTPEQIARLTQDPGTVGEADAQLAMNILRDNMPRGAHEFGVPPLGMRRSSPRDRPTLEARITRVESNDREQSARAARQRFEEALCCIDGALYAASQGPAWVVYPGPNGPASVRAVPELANEGPHEIAKGYLPDDPCMDIELAQAGPPRTGDIQTYGEPRVHPDDASAPATLGILLSNGEMASRMYKADRSDGLVCIAELMDIMRTRYSRGSPLAAPMARLADILDALELHHMARDARRPSQRAETRARVLENAQVMQGPAF